MKKYTYYLIFFTLFIHTIESVAQIRTAAEYSSPTGNYLIAKRFINRWFLPQITVHTLLSKNAALTQFQLPPYLESANEQPKFSPNEKYLLILNAEWQPIYQTEPSLFEWILFDITHKKQIKTFARGDNPSFSDNNTVSYGRNGVFVITQQEPRRGFFENMFNAVRSYMPRFISQQRQTSSTITKPTQQQSPAPIKTPQIQPVAKSQPIMRQPLSNQPQEINLPVEQTENDADNNDATALVPLEPAMLNQNALISMLSPEGIASAIKLINSCSTIGMQPSMIQPTIINQYFNSEQAQIASYRQTLQTVIQQDVPSSQKTLPNALLVIQKIDEKSIIMKSTGDMEVVNSPAIIMDLINDMLTLATIWIDLSQQEQKELLLKIVAVINKHVMLYRYIIEQMGQLEKPAEGTQAQNNLAAIENICQQLNNNTIQPLPAITQIVSHAHQIDKMYVSLSPEEKVPIQEQQNSIVSQYRNVLKQSLATNIQSSWQTHHSNIINLATTLCTTGMTSVLVGLLSQHFHMLINPNQPLNTTSLIAEASASIIAQLITELTHKKLSKTATALLSGGNSALIKEMAITPYLEQSNAEQFTFKAPSFTGPIIRALSYEAFSIINTMLEQQGGVTHIIQNTDFKKILLRPAEPSRNEITQFIQPKIAQFTQNKQLAFVMTDIGWKMFTGAIIGCGMYAAGLSQYPHASELESFYYASLEGIERGLATSLLSSATQQTGAIITVSSALALPSADVISHLMQGSMIAVSPQIIVPEIIATTAQVVTDFIADESGFKSVLTTVSTAVKSNWSRFYGSFASFSEVMFATETGDVSGYGAV